ncbi:unnamed protein product [Candida verbasci]|uniref:Proteasome component ECM29 n=1 Tax=Candida verbasci TaxID=1227364 RepID=A0A9W4XDH0_9ASCO|nr:unnamed protein product [Candida verbasci]
MTDELSLVNKVELRIALAESDEQLEKVLNTYIPALLLKLSSTNSQVRQAILKIIQHVIPRINAARSIKLPIIPLIKQVQVPNVEDSLTMRLYSTLFISRGVDRLNQVEKDELIPLIIKDISQYPEKIAARIFNILCKLLANWKPPMKGSEEADNFKKSLNLNENDEKYSSLVIGKFLLLQPESSNKVTAGLTQQENQFFTTEAGVVFKSKDEIFKIKAKLLEFIKCSFSDEQMVFPLLIASSDSSSSLNESAEILFKKLNVNYDDVKIWNNSFTNCICELFLGTKSIPVASSLQSKILQVLIKCDVNSQDITKISTIALGSDDSRLRRLGIEFVLKLSGNAKLVEFNENIAQQLRNGILSEGWPSMELSNTTNYHNKIKDRQLRYETIGSILKTYPSIFYKDWSFIEFLFESLDGDTPELRVSIQDALSGLTSYLNQLSNEQKLKLKQICKKSLSSSKNGSTKYIAVKFINATFPFNDPYARYLSVLGTSKASSPETIEESLNGLHPYWFNLYHINNTKEFKSTSYLLGQESTVEFPKFKEYIDVITSEEEFLPKAVEFGEQILVMESIKEKNTVIVPDQNWSTRLEKAVEVNEEVRKSVIEKISSGEINESLVKLLSLCIDHPSPITLTILAKLISFSSSNVVESLMFKMEDLLDLLSKANDDISLIQVCKVIGIIASHPNYVNEDLLIEFSNSKSKNAVIAACYIISRLTLRDSLVYSNEILERIEDSLLNLLQASNTYSIALDGISQLAMFGSLKNSFKFKEIIRSRVKKIDEKSVLALAYLTLLDKKEGFELTKDEQIIYDTYVSKQIEYIFTSSEALVIATSGWDSTLLQKQLDIPGESIKHINQVDRVSIILKYIFEACQNTKPSLRKAGCIWLLSLVQHCKHFPIIKEKATEIHITFMRFLGDKDELVVESASRGLGLIYEIGDVELKDTLVKSLLKSFTSSNTSTFTAGTVEHDTQLFEPDLLKTNDGSVSTYKDVLNLAQDCGDPSLVYKFMNLAKSSSLWSSRKGIAFGLENILSQSSLDNLLTKDTKLSSRLIPKLFRYRYDPNLTVQTSMNDIWNSIIKDTAKAVNANFTIILNEILNSMGNKEWRTRQASAGALNDLLQMVDLEKYEPRLNEIWTMSFRIIDDIKESVRKEGTKLTKNLSINLIRELEKGSNDSNQLLEFLIPFLLGTKGLLSDSTEVKEFALETLTKICKLKNQAIKAYIPELIENFINLFSTLEPEIINYLYLNSNKYNLNNNDIDAKRLKSVGNSPLMDSIEKLLNQLEDSNIENFIQRLEKSIKSSIGLPSKVSGSKIIVDLITNHYELIKPFGDKLLEISTSQINDRNETVATSYAASSGYVCKIASIDSVVKYSNKLNKMFFGNDEKARVISSVASEYVSRYSGEKYESVASAFLPLAFIGKNDEYKSVASNFEKEWIENTSGGISSIKLYFNEIIDIINAHFNTITQFSIRKTLAKSLNEICQRIDDVTYLNSEVMNNILNLLIVSNKGKSWDGKELIFEALIEFSILAKSYIVEHESLYLDVIKTIKVEIKRKNKNYQKQVILNCGKWLHYYQNEEILDFYIEILSNLINDVTDDDDDEEMEEMNVKQNIEFEEQKLTLLNNLQVVVKKPINHKLLQFIMESLINIFKLKNLENTWRSKLKATEIFNSVLNNLDETDDALLLDTWSFLKDKCLLVDSIENVKIQFIRLSKNLNQYLIKINKPTDIINDTLSEFKEIEKSNIILTEINK